MSGFIPSASHLEVLELHSLLCASGAKNLLITWKKAKKCNIKEEKRLFTMYALVNVNVLMVNISKTNLDYIIM
jgi:hypothetical protein